jgi:hypothetical protein
MAITPALRRALVLPLLALAGACTDRDPLLPKAGAEGAARLSRLECTVQVAAQKMSCVAAPATRAPGLHADIVGGQEIYVKMASAGTSYDAGTQILSSNVTVQNLLQKLMGTPDGVTVKGVDVFISDGFHVTSGSGTVSLANADGTGDFTGVGQPYYLYNEILTPYQISSSRQWLFNVPSTVGTFTFTAYVSTNTYGAATPLDRVWTGAVDSLWETAGNWQDGVVPDSTSTVAIPADSMLASHRMPVLSGNADIANVRVGYGSSLTLSGFTLTVRGNVDAVGTITGGTVSMTGSGALLGGNVSSLGVSGGASLQRPTVASGAVSVTGALAVKDQALSISIP